MEDVKFSAFDTYADDLTNVVGVSNRSRSNYFTAPEHGRQDYVLALHKVEYQCPQSADHDGWEGLRFTFVLLEDAGDYKAGDIVTRSLAGINSPARDATAKMRKQMALKELGQWCHALTYGQVAAAAHAAGQPFEPKDAGTYAAGKIRDTARLLVEEPDAACEAFYGTPVACEAWHAKYGSKSSAGTPGAYKYSKGEDQRPLFDLAPVLIRNPKTALNAVNDLQEIGDFPLLELAADNEIPF